VASLSWLTLALPFETGSKQLASQRYRFRPRGAMQGSCKDAALDPPREAERSLLGSVFIATTLDGKIADLDGDVSFLDDYQSTAGSDMDFGDFLASVDVIVMGRKSCEKVLSFGKDSGSMEKRQSSFGVERA
jgi:hypothetical protein